MTYKNQAVLITTLEEYNAARAAGAHIEFTACADWPGDPDTLDMPIWGGGFVENAAEHDHFVTDTLANPLPGDMFRAFYPEA